MLLGNDFNNCGSIRRKAYNMDNPVQAGRRSSGMKSVLPLLTTPSGVELRSSGRRGASSWEKIDFAERMSEIVIK